MTENDALRFLESRRTLGIQPGLERLRALLSRHGSPEKTLPAIHIAGTKGKGSTAAFIGQALHESGRRVGCFSSPWVYDPREQVRINNRFLAPDVFAATIARLRPNAEDLQITEFELWTALAFVAFANANVDIAVIETGMGGRDDATNILTRPLVTVLTPVGRDHTEFLGESIAEIARHKAGILKPNVPCAVNVPDPAARRIIEQTAKQIGAPLCFVNDGEAESESLTVTTPRRKLCGLTIGMRGGFQRQNAATAVTALDLLPTLISENAVRAGLLTANLPGRFAAISHPDFRLIADGAHNELSAQALADALKTEQQQQQQQRGGRLFLVVGMRVNHDPETFLAPLAVLRPAGLIAAELSPGGHPAATIAAAARAVGIHTLPETPSVPAAVAQLIDCADAPTKNDLVCITGSFVAVGDFGTE